MNNYEFRTRHPDGPEEMPRRQAAMTAYADFYRQSLAQPDAFWAEQARLIDWQTPPQQVCDYSKPPFAKWFVGGTTNLCHNAVDRHLATRASQAALVAISTETNTERSYSFAELHAEVQRMAAVLKSLGVQKGDRVLIYMPMIAEAAFAMLACVRIGALHSVVFGGFASGSLASRIEDAEPVAVVSADAGSRGGKVVPYKPLLDEAIALSRHKPAAVLMVDRGLAPAAMRAGRDHDWAALREQHLNTVVPLPGLWLPASGHRRPARTAAQRPAVAACVGARGANGWNPPTPATRCTPAAPRASPRACSATRVATPWRWLRA
jgi:propionyl-CoA synthetase